MATTSVSKTDVVSLNSLSFIRPTSVVIKSTGLRPSTRMYAFFDGVLVDEYITDYTNTLKSDINGTINCVFNIPPMKFNTGARKFLLQDNPVFDYANVNGTTVGQASAIYTARGYLKTLQETITNTTTLTTINDSILSMPNMWISGGGDAGGPGDPLAQSFFTFGVKGGCFITRITLYFGTKDSTIPVTVQLRKMLNGYPSKEMVSPFSSVTLSPAEVNVSSNAYLGTDFIFSRPIYLEEDSEYCFVIMTNSNTYNVWTAKLSEKAVESNQTIFEQPFIGSLFKSENNITWTAEQTEDIKFTLKKASFSPSAGQWTANYISPPVILLGSYFSVIGGSSTVLVTLPFQHEFKVNDSIALSGDPLDQYQANITYAHVCTTQTITSVPDEYSFTFTCGATAGLVTTGTFSQSGRLNAIDIVAGGAGYTSGTSTLTSTNGGGAQISVTIDGGVVIAASVVTPGSGYYTSLPTFTLPGAGSGASLKSISDALFIARVNRKYQSASMLISGELLPGTSLTTTLTTTLLSGPTGGDSYSGGGTSPIEFNKLKYINQAAVLTSTVGASTTQTVVTFNSNNANVSPYIDLGERPRLRLNNHLVNNLNTNETLDTGLAKARYVSKIVTLDTLSNGIKMFVEAASVGTSSFEVYIRTSLSSNNVSHRDASNLWVKLTSTTLTNMSKNSEDFRDYEFNNSTTLSQFDTYDIKIVLLSQNKYSFPRIGNYRTIILAT